MLARSFVFSFEGAFRIYTLSERWIKYEGYFLMLKFKFEKYL